MIILLINTGRSSVNVALYSYDSLERIFDVGIKQLSNQATTLRFGANSISVMAPDHASALSKIFDTLFSRSFDPNEIFAVGHRVPRINEFVERTALLSDEIEAHIESTASAGSAEISNCLKNIRVAKRNLPSCPHVVFFVPPSETDLDYEEMIEEVNLLVGSMHENGLVNSRPSTIPVAVSARHVHLSQETLQTLYGENYKLTPEHELSQLGQFAARETVTIIGPRNQFEQVRIIGPTRANNQIEISRSDEYYLGVHGHLRASGDTANTNGVKLAGPSGCVTLTNGVICALRHIHMHPDDAKRFAMNDGDLVDVVVGDGRRQLTFNSVLIRVNKAYTLEMHIDTDEANAAGLNEHDIAILKSTLSSARITAICKPI